MKNNSNTQQQVDGWLEQAKTINNEILETLQKEFADGGFVSYAVGVTRWNDFVEISLFMHIPNNKASDELRQLVGNGSLQMMITEQTKSDEFMSYYDTATATIRNFARRATLAKKIVEKQREQ